MRIVRYFVAACAALALMAAAGRAVAEDEESSGSGGDTEFAWLSVAPEAGYGYFFEGEFSGVNGEMLSARNAFVAKLHVDIGGDGLAVELAPLYEFEGCDKLLGDFNVLGGEVTLVYRFAAGSVYPSLGIGFHGAYIFPSDILSSGTQLYARAPLGLTWYFGEYLGLVVEAGVLYGGTGIKTKAVTISGTQQAGDLERRRNVLSDSMEFASGFGFDLLVGLRFP